MSMSRGCPGIRTVSAGGRGCGSPSTAAAAAAAAARDNVPTAEVVTARVEAWLQRQRREFDVVVLDPPRRGAGAKVVAPIAAASPRVVSYVACDPAALARDVATFAAHG